MEEDDATDARLYAVVCSKQQLAVQSPVLLCVLSIDALESLCHTTCTGSAIRDVIRRANELVANKRELNSPKYL